MSANEHGDSPADILVATWRAWARRDLDATMALVADNCTYTMHIPEDVMPFGGTTTGRASIRDRLLTLLDQFETIEYRPVLLSFDDHGAIGRVEFHFRHKATGEDLYGAMRHVAKIADGLITDLNEYHDVERIRAFARLIAASAADKSS